jgi:hypothetical protein
MREIPYKYWTFFSLLKFTKQKPSKVKDQKIQIRMKFQYLFAVMVLICVQSKQILICFGLIIYLQTHLFFQF